MAQDVSFQSIPISFAERAASSDLFKTLFRDGMALVEETAAYLDGEGRDAAKSLPRSAALAYAPPGFANGGARRQPRGRPAVAIAGGVLPVTCPVNSFSVTKKRPLSSESGLFSWITTIERADPTSCRRKGRRNAS